jgi:hypothetical protein
VIFLKFFLAPGPLYSRKKFFFILCISLLGVTGSAYGLFFLKNYWEYGQAHQSRHFIRKILQTGPLETLCLAELLKLSNDEPVNLYSLNLKESDFLLKKSHIIKECHLKKIKPDILFVDYSLREPIALIADFSNTAFDQEGVLFPLYPYLTPKRLPEVYLGENLDAAELWGKSIYPKKIRIAKDIFFLLKGIVWLDLSKIDMPSMGRREIVVILKKGLGHHFLRLNVKNYRQNIQHYAELSKSCLSNETEPCIIDFRLSNMAYITKGDKSWITKN